MAKIREIPQKFKTSDGREFAADQEAAAKRHQNFLDQSAAFDQSLTALNIAMAEDVITADGHPFTFERSTYYYVAEGFSGESVTSLSLWARYCLVRTDTDDQRTYIVDRQNDKPNRYDVANLYRNERNAHLRLLAIKKKRLGWLQEDIAKLAAGLGVQGDQQ